MKTSFWDISLILLSVTLLILTCAMTESSSSNENKESTVANPSSASVPLETDNSAMKPTHEEPCEQQDAHKDSSEVAPLQANVPVDVDASIATSAYEEASHGDGQHPQPDTNSPASITSSSSSPPVTDTLVPKTVPEESVSGEQQPQEKELSGKQTGSPPVPLLEQTKEKSKNKRKKKRKKMPKYVAMPGEDIRDVYLYPETSSVISFVSYEEVVVDQELNKVVPQPAPVTLPETVKTREQAEETVESSLPSSISPGTTPVAELAPSTAPNYDNYRLRTYSRKSASNATGISVRYCGLEDGSSGVMAALQMIYHTEALRGYFTFEKATYGPLHRQMSRLFAHMEHMGLLYQDSFFYPSAHLSEFVTGETLEKVKLSSDDGPLAALLEAIHYETVDAKKPQEGFAGSTSKQRPLQELLSGQLSMSIQCGVCAEESVKTSHFWQVDVPTGLNNESNQSLDQCIKSLLTQKALTGNLAPPCTRCPSTVFSVQSRSSSHRLVLDQLPSILLLHLKRPPSTHGKPLLVNLDEQLFIDTDTYLLHTVLVQRFVDQCATLLRQPDGQWSIFEESHITEKVSAQKAFHDELSPYGRICLYIRQERAIN